jgi:hypothetical protein
MIQCQGCDIISNHIPQGAFLNQRTPPGWGCVMDTANGLEARFFCPSCSEVIGNLARDIQNRVRLKNFHFPNLVKLGLPKFVKD